VAGSILLIAAVKNTQETLYYLLVGDFTGPNNFVYWLLAILIIGAIGYVPKLKPLSDGFLILVILVLFLSKGGFWAKFTQQIGVLQSARNEVGQGGTPGQGLQQGTSAGTQIGQQISYWANTWLNQ
jgi:hypothetical protein